MGKLRGGPLADSPADLSGKGYVSFGSQSCLKEGTMNLEELAQRVQVLEDIEAIKKLKARYTGYCDNGYDPDGIASLFTEDAVWDGGVFGGCEGREGIRKVFCEWSKLLPFALQYVFDPIMEIQRDTANGA